MQWDGIVSVEMGAEMMVPLMMVMIMTTLITQEERGREGDILLCQLVCI